VHLKGLTSLQTLNLSGSITDSGLVHLKGLTNLQQLYLEDTQITDAGVADLQKALPNCKIYK
jgi:Leucine-rich repeat (LRR) protein